MIRIIKTVTCDRCKKEIEENEPVWFINQRGEYGSEFDNEQISKDICDACMSDFMELGGEFNE